MTMIATLPQDRTDLRGERRVKKVRPSYLDDDVLARAAENGDRRLIARMREMQGECQLSL